MSSYLAEVELAEPPPSRVASSAPVIRLDGEAERLAPSRAIVRSVMMAAAFWLVVGLAYFLLR